MIISYNSIIIFILPLLFLCFLLVIHKPTITAVIVIIIITITTAPLRATIRTDGPLPDDMVTGLL